VFIGVLGIAGQIYGVRFAEKLRFLVCAILFQSHSCPYIRRIPGKRDAAFWLLRTGGRWIDAAL
jgi:hypothetical protein